jgi:tellurite methyltransferase
MTKPAELPPGSFVPSALTIDRLPPRQRWDYRYGTLSPEARVEPTSFVAACLPKLPAQGRALDVAAGAGRHTIALARRGLQVDAVDISTQGLRLARARALAAGLTPGEQIRFIVADIERPWLPHRVYEVILVSFFLCRPLFPLIKERLGPGGWLVYETFTAEQAIMSSGQPQRRQLLLKTDELKNAFSDFEILFYDEGEHNQKVTAQLLARKPSKI